MEIRPATASDLAQFDEIDGTIQSNRYLHLDGPGETFPAAWRLEERPLRSKLIARNALDDEARFAVKQLLIGAEDGIALVAEHEGEAVGLAAALYEPGTGTLRVADLRVDSDFRRNGLGLAMLYQCVQAAREAGSRAVAARTLSNNVPAAMFLRKASFELTGFDTHRQSNHDLVKEAVTLFWYLPLL